MAKAIDIGTSFIVGAELKGGKEIFTIERDAFFSMPKEDFAEEMLNDAGAKYLVKGDQIFVVGEDALKYCMITGKQDAYRRPMKKGVLNPGEEEAIPLLERLVEGIVGKPGFPGEVMAATIPAPPLDEERDVTFHRIVVERFLKKLGYDVRILNEALAIIYAENPTVADSNGGAPAPFSGIGMSFGAGMTNLVVAWRAKKLFEISVARGGDWIDESVSKVRNVPVGKVTNYKEKKLNLAKIDPRDSIAVGLDVYYDELIRFTLKQFAGHFKTSQATLDQPMEIVVAGGTAMVPGFLEKFNAILDEVGAPLPIKGVRLSKDPLKSVAKGSLVAAVSMEKKKLAEQKKHDAPAPVTVKDGRVVATQPSKPGVPAHAAPAVSNDDDFPEDIDLSKG